MKPSMGNILIMFAATMAAVILILGIGALICSPIIMVLSWWIKGLISNHQLGIFLICAFVSLFLLFIIETASNEGETE